MKNRTVAVFDFKGENPKDIQKIMIGKGKFHQWGLDFLEGYESGFTNYTVAIVEMDDGTVKSVMPEMIQFLDD